MDKQYPEGKWGEDDEGALITAVSSEPGRVRIRFSQQVWWIGFPPEQAIEFAQIIIEHAEAARKELNS